MGHVRQLPRVGGLSRPPRRAAPRRRRAAWALLAGVLFVAATHVGFGLVLDHGPERLRDPEYGTRLEKLRARVAEHPSRPLVLVLGSSRTAMGVRPGVLDGGPRDPMLFNFALAGSGPVMELMAFRRATADGVIPAAVVIEYWPAFLREDGPYAEDGRIDPVRLRDDDRPLVREFYRDPVAAERTMDEHRRNPWHGHRKSLLNQFAPRWVPKALRAEAMWEPIDDWGWLPGRESANPDEYVRSREAAAAYYVPLFTGYDVSPVADRAMRQLIAEVRARGLPVALLYLPEAESFRSLMPADVRAKADAHLRGLCAELGVPLIDGRGWVPDDQLADGFHLMRPGAAEFTRKLAPKVTERFFP